MINHFKDLLNVKGISQIDRSVEYSNEQIIDILKNHTIHRSDGNFLVLTLIERLVEKLK